MDASAITVETPEELSDYLNKLPAYDISWNQDVLLDITRDIQDSENYYWVGVPFPTGGDIFFNQPGSGNVLQTFSGDINVPAFSILTKITAYSGPTPNNGPPGPFKLRVYDKGGKVDMVHKQWSIADNVTGRMKGEISGSLLPPPDDPFGPYYLTSPMYVMPPGVLQMEITDLSGIVNQIIQVLLTFAVPKTAAAMGMQQIEES